MNYDLFYALLRALDRRPKLGLGGRPRKRLVRPELRVQRVFDWFNVDGDFKVTGDFADGEFIETLDYRLESAVIGRAQAEAVSLW